LGIAPDKIHSVLGVAKAYTTRVGEGPFPTEIFDETGKFLLQKGNEFGATTGRPRRCGWFDAVAVSYACRINGIKKIALTKPDVLEGLPKMMICVGYRYKQDLLHQFPTESWVLKDVVPEYKEVKGWEKSFREVTTFADFPDEFKDYIKTIEDLIEARVDLVSTGMERKDTVFRKEELMPWLDLERVEAEL
jgi:adenylosuccinate synthase